MLLRCLTSCKNIRVVFIEICDPAAMDRAWAPPSPSSFAAGVVDVTVGVRVEVQIEVVVITVEIQAPRSRGHKSHRGRAMRVAFTR